LTWTTIRISIRLFYRRIGTFLIGNVFWILVSIPIVTIPAATGALFYMVHRVVSEEEDNAPEWASHKDFWVGLRLHWLRSTVVGFLDLAALIVLLVTLQFYVMRPEEYLRWLAGPVLIFLLMWIGLQVFLFPLLIQFPDESLVQLAKRAVFLVLGYPLYCLTVIAVLVVLLVVSVALAGPVLVLLFSLLAVIQTVALRVIRIEQLGKSR
jgi:uncharacterized membrane protein YesL